jgi:hypothetical protein
MTPPVEEKTTSGVRVFPDGPSEHARSTFDPAEFEGSYDPEPAPKPETVVPKSVAEPEIAPVVIETEHPAQPAPAPVSDRHGRTKRPGALTADSPG